MSLRMERDTQMSLVTNPFHSVPNDGFMTGFVVTSYYTQEIDAYHQLLLSTMTSLMTSLHIVLRPEEYQMNKLVDFEINTSTSVER